MTRGPALGAMFSDPSTGDVSMSTVAVSWTGTGSAGASCVGVYMGAEGTARLVWST